MRGAGAARRREQEAEPPPDPSAVVAKLERLSDATAALIATMERRDAGCGDPYAAVLERISLAAHWAEGREQLAELAGLLPPLAAVWQSGIEEGRRREAAERDEAAVPLRAHRHRKPRLTVVGGLAASGAVAAAATAATTMIATQDSAWMHPWSPRPAAVQLHHLPPDTAVLVPQGPPSWSSPRPSMAAASARPAPSVTASPSAPVTQPAPPPPSSPPPVVAPDPGPALDVPRFLDLGAVTRGPLTLTAGNQDVTWTVTTTDGITVMQNGAPVTGGTLAAGQELDLTVAAPLGGGVIYFSAGPRTWTVVVTSDLAPAMALR